MGIKIVNPQKLGHVPGKFSKHLEGGEVDLFGAGRVLDPKPIKTPIQALSRARNGVRGQSQSDIPLLS